ncbi:MAG: DUF58 domain-containing protein [Waddliaceae bacterium]
MTFSKIRTIEYQSEKLATDMLAGAWRSAFRGQGIEFEEVRPYQPGDDTRSIDWNVTARTGSPHVKTFQEERELTLFFIIDHSASIRFGSGNQLKQDLMAELIATLSFSAIKNNDKVGLLLFSNKVNKVISPKKGTRHVLRLIQEVLNEPTAGETDINAALRYFGHLQQKPCICFLLSDFLTPIKQNELTLLAKKHDLIALHIQDPLETNLPSLGYITYQDLESKEILTTNQSGPLPPIDITGFKKAGVSYIPLMTNEPYIPPLRKFFKERSLH